MNLEKGNVITLENNKNYLILDNFIYNNEQYLYISSLDIRHICFVKVSYADDDVDIHILKDENLIKQFAQNYILNYSNQKPSLEEFFNIVRTSTQPNKLEYLLGLLVYNTNDETVANAIKYLENKNLI